MDQDFEGDLEDMDTGKDENMQNERIYLAPHVRDKVVASIKSDTAFLADHDIMDYSFILQMEMVGDSFAARSRGKRLSDSGLVFNIIFGAIMSDPCQSSRFL